AATLGQLREIAEFLADIHGQHAHHSLLRVEAQRALLDSHAGAQTVARDVAEAYAAWRTAREARLNAEKDVETSARQRELLEWQLKELTDLGFDPVQWREEELEQRRLSNAHELLAGAAEALGVMEEGEAAALPVLHHVGARLMELSSVDVSLNEAAQLLDSALIQLQESALALRRYQDRLELDPARLAELDRRIDAVTQMARKHRAAPEELPSVLQQMQASFDELSLRADPHALAERERQTHADFQKKAQKLTSLRTRTAKALTEAVTAGMQELAMAGGRFAVVLTPLAEGAAHGLEEVEFCVTANAGQPLRSLAKVASGGELSRIGLALQVIASQATAVETLIFDEVDVGIGGRVAEIVGRMLKELGLSRQVLCVTHLPQVAAQANWQWSISKETRKGMTLSSVTALDDAGRIGEIARMLGGEKITDTTRRHAAEMLGLPL
ncbi:MAG TPA: DNA repair protein RecN, partial [Rhodocyclaceae bacterium]|nr:DNA repair protein RecN [Rhodocyclaceae bacterium]